MASLLASAVLGGGRWFSSRQTSRTKNGVALQQIGCEADTNTTKVVSSPYNTFDGDGFPACNSVSMVYRPSTVDEIVALVENASASGTPIRASGVGPHTLFHSYKASMIVNRMDTCGVHRFLKPT